MFEKILTTFIIDIYKNYGVFFVTLLVDNYKLVKKLYFIL